MSLQGGKRKQETVQRIEDVGNILLSVQRELERVRGVLDRMPETDPEVCVVVCLCHAVGLLVYLVGVVVE